MTPQALLAALRARGVSFTLREGVLHYRAPVGAMTPRARALLQEHRALLIAGLADVEPVPVLPVVAPATATFSRRSPLMETLVLSQLQDPNGRAVLVASSNAKPYRVVVRVVAPPGSFAVFAFNAAILDSAPSAFPAGQTFVVPTAQDAPPIRLANYAALYGRGSLPNTVISVLSTELLPDEPL